MIPTSRSLLICCLIFAAFPAVGGIRLLAAEDDQKASTRVSYYKEIRPIFQRSCQGCHQPAKASGKFVITSYAAIRQGGGSEEPVVVPGNPQESLLFQEITPQDGEPPSMPKGKDPLSTASIERIRRWIAQGAKDDTPKSANAPLVTMENPPRYRSPPVLTSIDYSPDGTLLAVSGYHEVLLHESDGSGLVARLVGLSERIESAVFSLDGKYLAVAGGSPGRTGEVQIWDVAKRKLRLSVPVTHDTVYGASWSRDGKLIAFGCSDNTLRAIDAKTGKQVMYQGAHSDWVLDTAFSVDNSHLVSVSRDRSLKLVEVKTERFVDNITSITPGALLGGLIAVDCHPERDELLVGGADGAPKIYRMHREKKRELGDDFNLLRKFDSMPGRIFDAEFNRDGTRIAVGSSFNGTGEVRVYAYEEKDSKMLWKLEIPAPVYAVTFSPDGKTVAAGGFDGTVRLISVEGGKQIKRFLPIPLQL